MRSGNGRGWDYLRNNRPLPMRRTEVCFRSRGMESLGVGLRVGLGIDVWRMCMYGMKTIGIAA
jgi:hypothetical protein